MTIKAIRKFNRYYTKTLGVFKQNVFELPYSMGEMRVLGEIGRHKGLTANVLTQHMNMDKSSFSRTINKLEKNQLIRREKDVQDRRAYRLFLTEKGSKLNTYVEEQSDLQMSELLADLSKRDQQKLVESMVTIEQILQKVVPNRLEEE